MTTKSLQSCSILCDPMDCSPPGSSVHVISQARILEWVFMPSSRWSFHPRDQTHISYVSCIGRWIIYLKVPRFFTLGKPRMKVLVAHLCQILCNLTDYSPPGSSGHRILQAKILEWVTIPFSRGSYQPRDQTWISCLCRWILYHLIQHGGY